MAKWTTWTFQLSHYVTVVWSRSQLYLWISCVTWTAVEFNRIEKGCHTKRTRRVPLHPLYKALEVVDMSATCDSVHIVHQTNCTDVFLILHIKTKTWIFLPFFAFHVQIDSRLIFTCIFTFAFTILFIIISSQKETAENESDGCTAHFQTIIPILTDITRFTITTIQTFFSTWRLARTSNSNQTASAQYCSDYTN